MPGLDVGAFLDDSGHLDLSEIEDLIGLPPKEPQEAGDRNAAAEAEAEREPAACAPTPETNEPPAKRPCRRAASRR